MRLRSCLAILFGGWLLLPGGSASGQGEKPNLFGANAGFEQTKEQDNLWDGVSKEGYLSGLPFSAMVLSENGLRTMALPPSVAFADLDGDGKPDLITADGYGYFRFYKNVGTVAEPKFTNAEIIPIYVSANPARDPEMRDRPPDPGDPRRFTVAREVPRFALADWRHSGVLDLLIGNLFGEVLFIPNTGTNRQPAFRQPRPVETALLKLNPKGLLTWNLLAPAAIDLSGRGHLDLVLGEGTYSANAIRLLENGSQGGTPSFNEERTWYLAYGDGKEQLIPTVVDYNGDGIPDVLVADRTGQVSVFLNPGPSWKPGDELPFTSKVTFGGSDRLPGLVSLCAVDFNGDGLFDLLMGLPNGRIAVALNTGTKGSPKFGPPKELKGVKRLAPYQVPTDWGLDTSLDQYTHLAMGNALGYLAVVDAKSDPDSKPPEGTHCLKAGYFPAYANLFPPPFENMPGDAHGFSISHDLELEIGRSYTLSFQVKGTGVTKASFSAWVDLHRIDQGVKVEIGERGAAKKTFLVANAIWRGAAGEFNASGNWETVSKSFTFQTEGRELPNGTKAKAHFGVGFSLERADANLYLDDFQLVQQGK